MLYIYGMRCALIKQFLRNILLSFGITLGSCAALSQTAPTNILTQHYNSARTGWNQNETQLTPQTVASRFASIGTVYLDGQVDAQPLVVPNQSIAGYSGTYQIVYVATENNTVYAINSANGKIMAKQNFGPPVQMPLGCGNNSPTVGINSTPVINLTNGTLDVIVYTLINGSPTYVLHSISLKTLNDVVPQMTVVATNTLQNGNPVEFNATYQRQRSALLLSGGIVYAAFASFCDFGANVSRGWVLGWNATTLAPLPANELTDKLPSTSSPNNYYLSSIWMSGAGPAVDNQGYLYFSTGNSDWSGTTYNSVYNYSESVVKVSPDLRTVASEFTPSNVSALDRDDLDVSAVGILAVPANAASSPPLLAAGSKDGRLFVLSTSNLGGFAGAGGTDNVLFEQTLGANWFGSPSYFMGPDNIGRIVSSAVNTVATWTIKQNAGSTSIAQEASAQIDPSEQSKGFFTAISSNGTQPGTGLIWFTGHKTQLSNNPVYPVTLYAFSTTPSKGALPLVGKYPAGSWPNIGGAANIVPVVANGNVFVATNKQLIIFGLAPGVVLTDLVVSSLSYNYTTGLFSCVVSNPGGAATPAGIPIGVSYLVDGNKVTWGAVTGALPAGGAVKIGTGGGNFNIPSGTHLITVFADDVNRMAESNKSNNTLSLLVSPPGTIPDLVPTSLSYDSSTGLFTSVVQNQGSAPTPANISIGVAYSVDGKKVSWGAAWLPLAPQGQLAPGKSVTIYTGGSPYFIPNGTHTISVLADDADRIANRRDRTICFLSR